MILTRLTLLMPAFVLPSAPADLTVVPSLLNRTLPYPHLTVSRSFGERLEPRYIVGAESLDQ